MMETFREILTSLITVDRDLEPWVEDVIVDHVNNYPGLKVEVECLLKADIRNVRVQLRLLRRIADWIPNSLPKLLSRALRVRDTFPVEVLEVLANTSVLKCVSDHDMEAVTQFAVKCARHFNFNVKTAAVNLLSCLDADSILDNILVEDDIRMSVISCLYKVGNKEKAVSLYKAASFTKPTHHPQLAEVELSVFMDIPREVSRESFVTYYQPTLYWKKFYSGLFAEGVKQEGDDTFLFEVIGNLSKHRNTTVLSAVAEIIEKNLEVCDDFVAVFRQSARAHKLLDVIMERLLDECSTVQEFKSSKELLLSWSRISILSDLVMSREKCYHSSRCDVITIACVVDSFITLIKECSLNRYDDLIAVLRTLLSLPCTCVSQCTCAHSCTCESICMCFNQNLIEQFLVSQVTSPHHFRQEHILDHLRYFNRKFISRDIISHVIKITYSDADMFIKEATYTFLCSVSVECIRDLVVSVDELLFKQISFLVYEDSSLVIEFFKYFQHVFSLYHSFFEDNIQHLPKKDEENSKPQLEVPNTKKKILNIDEIISEICNAEDCNDVRVIRRYHDNIKPISRDPIQMLQSLLNLITCDRCDIERLKQATILLTHILSVLPVSVSKCLITHLQISFIPLLNASQSPYLVDSVTDLQNVLLSCGFDNVNLLASSTSKGGDLNTVLELLQATPDPSIVMDCY